MITEQRTDASAVLETDDALLVLERMDEGFYAVDRDWHFRYVNHAAEVFWGLERDRMLGHSMHDLFPRFRGSASYLAHLQAFGSGSKPSRPQPAPRSSSGFSRPPPGSRSISTTSASAGRWSRTSRPATSC